MTEIIIINSELDKCVSIRKNEKSDFEYSYNNIGELVRNSLDKDKITFVLSKYVAYRDKLEIPSNNKSIFINNAKNIIEQEIDNQSQKILVQKHKHNEIPYIVISDDAVNTLNFIQNELNLKYNKILLEKDLYESTQDMWYISYQEDGITIYFDGKVLQSTDDTLEKDIKVLLKREKKPETLQWSYGLYADQPLDRIQKLQLQLTSFINANQESKHVMKYLHKALSSNNSLLNVSKLSNSYLNISYSYLANWKSFNLLLISFMFLVILLLQYSNTSKFTSQIELRYTNILSSVFRDIGSENQTDDLDRVIRKISYNNSLPKVNYINTLNEIGNIFNQPQLKLKTINLTEQEMNMTLIAQNDQVLKQLNIAIQENKNFSFVINSIENIDDKKILINLSFTYRNV